MSTKIRIAITVFNSFSHAIFLATVAKVLNVFLNALLKIKKHESVENFDSNNVRL